MKINNKTKLSQILQITANKYWKLLTASVLFIFGGISLIFFISNGDPQSQIFSVKVMNMIQIFCLFFVGLGILILYSFFNNLVLFTEKLLNNGKRVQGEILSFEDDPIKSQLKAIRYQYQDETGKTHSALSANLNKIIFEDLKVGDVGEVCYDNESPEKSIWIGDDWRKFVL